MNRRCLIWRESVYHNNFRCNICGTNVAKDSGEPLDTTLFDMMGNFIVCPKCYNPVAVEQTVDVSEDVEGLQGSYDEFRKKQKREKRRFRRR